MSDLDAMAREHSELELFIKDALSDKYFNLKNDKDTVKFLEVIFDGAHKQHDMSPMQVTEKKLMMKKEDILKAIKEVLAENEAHEIESTDGTKTVQSFANSAEAAAFKAKNNNIKSVQKLEEEEAMVPSDDRVSYLEIALGRVWNMGRGNNKIDLNSMAQELVNDMFTESLDEDLDLGHEDDEPHMIKSELYKIAKYSLELYKMVDQFEGKGEVDFPAWWQSKITKATSMISSAKHYLEFELTEPAMDQAVIGSETPIAEKLDPVGHEDEDIDNDGKVDKTDKYLKGRRVKIGQAIAQHSKKK